MQLGIRVTDFRPTQIEMSAQAASSKPTEKKGGKRKSPSENKQPSSGNGSGSGKNEKKNKAENKSAKQGQTGKTKAKGAKVAKAAPLSNQDFTTHAKALPLKLGEKSLQADPRTFKSGSFGWSFSGKHSFNVNGIDLPVQISLNMTVVGSKPIKQKGESQEKKGESQEKKSTNKQQKKDNSKQNNDNDNDSFIEIDTNNDNDTNSPDETHNDNIEDDQDDDNDD